MAYNPDETDVDTLQVDGEPKSSCRILDAISKAQNSFSDWQGICDGIDDTYGRREKFDVTFCDPEYDLFWASIEVIKPAIYARAPKPVVSPMFKDRRKLQNTTADFLERSIVAGFYRANIDEAMQCTRNDLIFYNRGVMWVSLEDKDNESKVCIDHIDRKDFVHPPCRKWSDVPWVARRAWMTMEELKDRFEPNSGDAYQDAVMCQPDRDGDATYNGANYKKAGVWEVWHKADKKVYWVTEGVKVQLDSSDPYLKLDGFFPCPRPAYGTLRPRTLTPVPDYLRYQPHLRQINKLTSRIYTLLDQVKLKVFIPGGSTIGDAVEQAFNESNDMIVIPVPSAALAGEANNLMVTLPLADIATAIQGLIQARQQLFSDYDRLSGISDIMRGETEPDETLGAQQLKSQYGSVRVRDKIDELQRIARDVTQITAEIMSEHFSQKLLMEMSQMELPTKADLDKRVREIESQAKQELQALNEQAQKAAQQAQMQMAQQQQMPPQGAPQPAGMPGQQQQPNPQQMAQQAQAEFQKQQQAIIAKYQPQLKQVEDQVPIDDVMKLLRDDKARHFAFEIETDSTVLTDEAQEKASRNEFLQEFTSASQGLMGLSSMGEAGAKLAGEMLKFVLQPYRVGRSLNSVIDEFIDSAPQIAQQNAQNGNKEAEQAVADAQQKLAQAELIKAQAQVAKVQADAQSTQVDNQRKIAELQNTAQESERKFAAEIAKLQADVKQSNAKVDNLNANTALTLSKIGDSKRTQDREDIKVGADIGLKTAGHQHNVEQSMHNAQINERQQAFSESQGERQQTLAEQQALQAQQAQEAQQAGMDNGQ